METKNIENNIEQEVEETLGILKQTQKRESNPYTYSKVMAKLSRNGKLPLRKKYTEVIKYSLLVLAVIINLVTVIKITVTEEVQGNNISNQTETKKNLETIATEYNLFINY